MSEKEEKEEKKGDSNANFIRGVVLKLTKMKAGNKRNSKLLYEKSQSRLSYKSNPTHKAFMDKVRKLKEEGKTEEEVAKLMEGEALESNIIRRKIKEKKEEKAQEKKEEKVKEERDSKEEKEPTPVIDRPFQPLIDIKEPEKKAPPIPPRPILRQPMMRQTIERYLDLLSKTPLSEFTEEKLIFAERLETLLNEIREKEREEARIKRGDIKLKDIAEKEAIAKVSRVEGKQEGREELIQEMKEGKFKPPPPGGTLPPTLQTVRDVAPSLISGGVTLLAPGIGKGLAPGIRGVSSSIFNYLTEFFRSKPESKITVDIPSAEYKLRPIPIGLTGAYRYMEKYLKIYSKLTPEQKKKLEVVDKKLMTLKQQQTRAPQNEKVVKQFHYKVGQVINKMDTDSKDAKALNEDIKDLEEELDNIPDELEENFEPSLDNRLQLGLGQVQEMKRGSNFIPQLITSSTQIIGTLTPPEIVEALNSVITNITEVEVGTASREGDRPLQIPQITPTEAVVIKRIITGVEEKKEEEKKEEPEEKKEIEMTEEERKQNEEERRLKRETISKQEPYEGIATDRAGIMRDIGKTAGIITGVTEGATGLVSGVLKNIYNNIMETPITMPETQAQSDQKISSATGTMRPRFIVPSRDSVIPSMPKIRADDIQFSAFDYVPPGTEGGNGTARTNPLVLSQELEERLRYSNAGITISPGMGENVINMILTESELKALLLPRGPDINPIIYEFPIIDGDQAQNEVKRYDQNLIQVEKFSPYNEYNENYQLDEEVFGSILLSYVP